MNHDSIRRGLLSLAFAGAIAVTSCGLARAEEPAADKAAEKPAEKHVETPVETEGSAAVKRGAFLLYRGYGAAALQGGGNSFSGGAAWTPELHLAGDFDLRFSIGATPYVRGGGGELFVASEGKALLAWFMSDQWSIEAGGGVAFWINNGNLFTVGTAGLVDHLSHPILGFIDRLFADYSMVLTGGITHEVTLGGGFHL